jgi:hypothetical protein
MWTRRALDGVIIEMEVECGETGGIRGLQLVCG